MVSGRRQQTVTWLSVESNLRSHVTPFGHSGLNYATGIFRKLAVPSTIILFINLSDAELNIAHKNYNNTIAADFVTSFFGTKVFALSK